jgi:hypothetical protein
MGTKDEVLIELVKSKQEIIVSIEDQVSSTPHTILFNPY